MQGSYYYEDVYNMVRRAHREQVELAKGEPDEQACLCAYTKMKMCLIRDARDAAKSSGEEFAPEY